MVAPQVGLSYAIASKSQLEVDVQLSSSFDAVVPQSSLLPMMHWDGRSPTALIGQVEARLAAGARSCFVNHGRP